MPRQRFKTLTQQMFYILLTLRQERRGVDILEEGRVTIGSGTLYDLLEQFQDQEIIRQTRVEGRSRSYIITPKGEEMLEEEYRRICDQVKDYRRVMGEEETP